MGDFEQAAPWQTSAIAGCNRFLDRVTGPGRQAGWRARATALPSRPDAPDHQRKSALTSRPEDEHGHCPAHRPWSTPCMIWALPPRPEFETVLQLLNPFAPHMTEELWGWATATTGSWPCTLAPSARKREAKCVETTVRSPCRCRRQVKARLKVARTSPLRMHCHRQGRPRGRCTGRQDGESRIYVKGRLVNLAVKANFAKKLSKRLTNKRKCAILSTGEVTM